MMWIKIFKYILYIIQYTVNTVKINTLHIYWSYLSTTIIILLENKNLKAFFSYKPHYIAVIYEKIIISAVNISYV